MVKAQDHIATARANADRNDPRKVDKQDPSSN
jgi:hypothetical protein